jgi:hypothetical protein
LLKSHASHPLRRLQRHFSTSCTLSIWSSWLNLSHFGRCTSNLRFLQN